MTRLTLKKSGEFWGTLVVGDAKDVPGTPIETSRFEFWPAPPRPCKLTLAAVGTIAWKLKDTSAISISDGVFTVEKQ